MFKDAAKGLCKQQSQDSASENVTVNITTKLEQVTACSFLKCLLELRSGNRKLKEVKGHSNFFFPLHCTAVLFSLWSLVSLITPCNQSGPAKSSLCKLNSCFLPATGSRCGAVAVRGLRAPQILFMVHNRGGTTVSAAQSVLLSPTSD